MFEDSAPTTGASGSMFENSALVTSVKGFVARDTTLQWCRRSGN